MNNMNKTRHIAVGDVHGCITELRELLALVGYRPEADSLIFVGDLVDRGPDPAGVVRYVRELQKHGDVITTMGNHEEKLVRWFLRVRQEKETGKPNKMSPPHKDRLAQWQSMSDEDVRWLSDLPLAVGVAGWSAVHAGFENVPMTHQKPEKVIRCRWIFENTGLMAPFKKGTLEQPDGSINWTERWRGPENVVYGHAVHSLKDPRVDRVNGVECWGIDTGCCFGGRLTALCLESREVWQIDAKETYSDLRREILE